jgi:5-methylcytosine-specific restriction endonuclease McrA
MPDAKNKLQMKWKPLLFPIHKHQWVKAYKKLRIKISGYKSHYGLECIETLIEQVYGLGCPYCDRILDYRTISVDHDIPVSRGGESLAKNIQISCLICNRRKGRMTGEEYRTLLNYLESYDEVVINYILMKLSSRDWGTKGEK